MIDTRRTDSYLPIRTVGTSHPFGARLAACQPIAFQPNISARRSAMVNPFSATHKGTFFTHGVRVRRRYSRHRDRTCRSDLCTARFCTTRTGGLLDVVHDITPDELCDDLAELLAEQLDDAGVLRGQSEFELVFTGVVRSTIDGT